MYLTLWLLIWLLELLELQELLHEVAGMGSLVTWSHVLMGWNVWHRLWWWLIQLEVRTILNCNMITSVSCTSLLSLRRLHHWNHELLDQLLGEFLLFIPNIVVTKEHVHQNESLKLRNFFGLVLHLSYQVRVIFLLCLDVGLTLAHWHLVVVLSTNKLFKLFLNGWGDTIERYWVTLWLELWFGIGVLDLILHNTWHYVIDRQLINVGTIDIVIVLIIIHDLFAIW